MNEPKPDFSNKSYLLPHINREGRRFGIPTLVVAAMLAIAATACAMLVAVHGGDMPHHALFVSLAAVLAFLAAPFLLLAYGVFLFFRDPERYPPEDEAAILSPADGRICMVKDCPLPAELLDALPDGVPPQTLHTRVSVFMSVFNVHVNRMPTAAKILKMAHVKGKFFNASLDKASTDNERCCYLMQTPCGTLYGVVLFIVFLVAIITGWGRRFEGKNGEELKEEDIKAKFVDGILKISVPKKQPEEKIETPKFIQIEG